MGSPTCQLQKYDCVDTLLLFGWLAASTGAARASVLQLQAGLGLGESRTWFKESRQQHPGIQMKLGVAATYFLQAPCWAVLHLTWLCSAVVLTGGL